MIIDLVKQGFIQKQIIEVMMSKGYPRTYSNARHLVHKVVVNHKLDIHKYCPTSRCKTTETGAVNTENKYIHRSNLFKFLWLNGDLTLEEKEYIFKKYPNIKIMYRCILEFREIYKTKKLSLLYLFIERYTKLNIPKIASFAKGLLKDIAAVEESVSNDLSNGFVEGTNSKLKMVKRTMYGRCRKELLEAKLMLII